MANDSIIAIPLPGGGRINIKNPLISAYVHKTAAYTTRVGDHIIGVDTSGGTVIITLASITVIAGRTIIIKDEGGQAAANNITVATEGTETIDGNAANDVINVNWEARGYYSDGTNWFKV